MPEVSTDFCAEGFAFVGSWVERGGRLACLKPSTKWRGRCTAQKHSRACQTAFDNKDFCLSRDMSLKTVVKLNARSQAIVLNSMARHGDLDDLHFFAANGCGASADVCSAVTQGLGVAEELLAHAQTHSNNLCSPQWCTKMVRDNLFSFAWQFKAAYRLSLRGCSPTERNLALELYADWMCHRGRLPPELHPPTTQMIKKAVGAFPPEIRDIIFYYVFMPHQGCVL